MVNNYTRKYELGAMILKQHQRLPSAAEFHVLKGELKGTIKPAPKAEINIFGLGDELPFEFMHEVLELSNSSCVFVRDSGYENALV